MDNINWIETIGGLYAESEIGDYFLDYTPIGYYLTTATAEIGLYETEAIAKKTCERFHDCELKKYLNRTE